MSTPLLKRILFATDFSDDALRPMILRTALRVNVPISRSS